MSSFKEQVNDVITNLLNEKYLVPIAKYVLENLDTIKEKNEDELVDSLREILEMPVPIISSSNTVSAVKPAPSMSSMAPMLIGSGTPSGVPGLGPIVPNTAAAKKKVTRKEHPPQVWMSLEEYQKNLEDGAKICGYYSSRSKDETKKDKVCGAAVDDTSNENPHLWRCTQCVGKAGVEKQIKKAVNGIDPTKSLSAPIPSVPMPSALPSLSTIGSGEPKALAPLPETIPVPMAKPMTPAPKLSLAVHPGLKPSHLKASNPDMKDMIFNVVDRATATVVVIGKYPLTDDPISSEYEYNIQQLTDEEQRKVRRYGVNYTYTCLTHPVAEVPALPATSAMTLPPLPVFSASASTAIPAVPAMPVAAAIPAVPAMPAMPSLAGLPNLPNLPGLNIPGL